MGRLQSLSGISASLSRRELSLGLAAAGLASCSDQPPLTAARTPKLDMDGLNKAVGQIAARARPGILGVGLMNLESGEHFTWAGDRRFPMQSVFKVPLAACVLKAMDSGQIKGSETLTISDKDLSPAWSPIGDAWPGRAAYTVDELLAAAVVDSDNTAADVLMKRIGGPGQVTAWLVAQQVNEIRVDRYERELQPERLGMASFRAAWKGAAAFDAAMATVAPATRRAATLAYMADPRDTATPRGMLNFLSKLDGGQLLSAASTRRILTWMFQTPRGSDRIKAGLPADARFAHKPGSSGADLGLTAAFNDVGVLTLKDRRSYALAAFLSGSTANSEQQAALFADLGRALAKHLG